MSKRPLVDRLQFEATKYDGELRSLLFEAAERIIKLQEADVQPPRFVSAMGDNSHITKALRASVREERVGYSYLFSGPINTCKMLAKDFAQDLTCEDPRDGIFCGECDSCATFVMGMNFQNYNLDCVHNNKVDDIRDLMGKLALGPPGRRVFTLHNVDLLTVGAANVLLHILQEPPEHAVFLMTTGKPSDLPLTLRSLTQHFEVR